MPTIPLTPPPSFHFTPLTDNTYALNVFVTSVPSFSTKPYNSVQKGHDFYNAHANDMGFMPT